MKNLEYFFFGTTLINITFNISHFWNYAFCRFKSYFCRLMSKSEWHFGNKETWDWSMFKTLWMDNFLLQSWMDSNILKVSNEQIYTPIVLKTIFHTHSLILNRILHALLFLILNPILYNYTGWAQKNGPQ